jgi:hypothetical protein
LATLTPPQATHIAVEVLGSLGSLQDESGSYGAFNAEDVLIGADGTLRLAERNGDFTPGTASAAAVLVDQLARNADRPAAHRRPQNAALLAALARCAAELPDGDLAAPLAELRRELNATRADRDHLKRELAALVGVPLVRVGADVPAASPVSAPAEAPAMPIVIADQLPEQAADLPPSPPDIEQPPVLGRRVPRGRLIAIVVIAVVALAAVISAIALNQSGGHPAAANTPASGSSHPAAPTKPAAPPAGHRSIPTLAPRAAGPISAVTLKPLGTCKAGAVCAVNVRIHLRPPSLSALSWRAALVNRCTGKIHTINHGSMIAGPGWQSAYATVRLHLPHKPSMAVLAVVDTPVHAASRPLLVPAGGGTCRR